MKTIVTTLTSIFQIVMGFTSKEIAGLLDLGSIKGQTTRIKRLVQGLEGIGSGTFDGAAIMSQLLKEYGCDLSHDSEGACKLEGAYDSLRKFASGLGLDDCKVNRWSAGLLILRRMERASLLTVTMYRSMRKLAPAKLVSKVRNALFAAVKANKETEFWADVKSLDKAAFTIKYDLITVKAPKVEPDRPPVQDESTDTDDDKTGGQYHDHRNDDAPASLFQVTLAKLVELCDNPERVAAALDAINAIEFPDPITGKGELVKLAPREEASV